MRVGEENRKTSETEIFVRVNLDGEGKANIASGIGFLNHMINIFTKHSGFDIEIEANGDLDIDMHHTVEDIGIVLGRAINKALGDKKGIERFGSSIIPMDETLCMCAVDISGRPYWVYNVPDRFNGIINRFDTELIREFIISFTNNLKANIHIQVFYGNNKHHIAEAIFKSLARALKKATRISKDDIPSTKGVLD